MSAARIRTGIIAATPDITGLAGAAALIRGLWMLRPWLGWCALGLTLLMVAALAAATERRAGTGGTR